MKLYFLLHFNYQLLDKKKKIIIIIIIIKLWLVYNIIYIQSATNHRAITEH